MAMHRKMRQQARQLPITGSAHNATNGRRPLVAATGIAPNAKEQRRANGSPPARPSFCRFPTSIRFLPCPRRSLTSPIRTRRRSTISCSRLPPRPCLSSAPILNISAHGSAFISVLHTWGSAMTHHPHVHMIAPGGGVSLDIERWIACRRGAAAARAALFPSRWETYVHA